MGAPSTLTLSGGEFGGTGAITFEGLTFDSGTLSGAGDMTITGAATFSAGGGKTLDKTLIIQGTGIFSSSTIDGTGSLVNEGTASVTGTTVNVAYINTGTLTLISANTFGEGVRVSHGSDVCGLVR